MKALTIEELYALSKALPICELILDVRQPDEFATGHVPGSRNIPHDEIGNHADELRSFKRIHLYCRSGGRVQVAMADLASRGVLNLSGVVSGGMPDWIAAGYPTE